MKEKLLIEGGSMRTMKTMKTIQQERALNQQAALKLRKKLQKTHMGKFVGIVKGRVAAEGETIEEVLQKLKQIEPDPNKGLVFQVGEEYPEEIVIL